MGLVIQIGLSVVGGDESRESAIFTFGLSVFDGQDVML